MFKIILTLVCMSNFWKFGKIVFNINSAFPNLWNLCWILRNIAKFQRGVVCVSLSFKNVDKIVRKNWLVLSGCVVEGWMEWLNRQTKIMNVMPDCHCCCCCSRSCWCWWSRCSRCWRTRLQTSKGRKSWNRICPLHLDNRHLGFFLKKWNLFLRIMLHNTRQI